jgi:hypothetical protein
LGKGDRDSFLRSWVSPYGWCKSYSDPPEQVQIGQRQ